MLSDEELRTYEGVNIKGLQAVANELIRQAAGRKIWLFHGEMGSGKTTLIKAICGSLDVQDLVSSPTFSIVNEYRSLAGSIFHFDFYRIKNEAEAYEIGTDEYFYSGQYCFVEWPDKIPSLIPSAHVAISIQAEDNEHRTIA
ncbi:MAG TPA: tRNA (adenosine(37)-N6)-threonylcarbamoyltransferase complex ATPase subunit type 1 TsaE, partial [Cyclobacteriaceae bacterium]|nr:tRNA (adenosine(37)-N6)-threonylcarbamoyltransferase complex ATPase subunit type 1 TsaE [Cyclobacteriaceae bacterium]